MTPDQISVRANKFYAPILERIEVNRSTFVDPNSNGNTDQAGAHNIVVTSCKRKDGRSTTALGLARAAAQIKHGKQILLLDADLRNSRLAAIQDLADSPGLREILAGAVEPAQAFQATSISNLTFLAAGRAAVALPDAFSSSVFMELLEVVHRDFDMVIVDSPAVNHYADGKLLAELLGVAVLVVRSGKSNQEDVEKAKSTLGRRLMGVVLNRYSDPVPGFLRSMV